ncbi:ral guanine nucleotide dissociation stimulator-like [Dasypus novemcinctus]|uniref:ral guanine nucleotide dissociation stimulator-like n=1 Tax=Dasypus novemcinctus TaxID=9361 RepID=UPI00265D661F|nr:ral guanine nucleotide dissociation stimulator-like [Dasypus novemcinctus]
MPSSSPSIQPRAMQTNHMHGYSHVLYKWQGGPCGIVCVSLYEDNVKYKSILVTSQDRALAGISKALEEHSLHQDKPEDYKLVQIISDNRMLQIPHSAKVYYTMDPSAHHHYLLLKQNTPVDAKVKDRAISALLGSMQKGPKFQKGKF